MSNVGDRDDPVQKRRETGCNLDINHLVFERIRV